MAMPSAFPSFGGNASSSQHPDTMSLKKYDVFISFRGEDTRAGFTSHLHDALCRSYVQTYIDNRLEKGDEVWAELVKAIKDSNVFLVAFSKNYASSTWCLTELVEIMECKKNEEDVAVIPVFYGIDPSQVRRQTGSYGTALAKHKKRHGQDKLQKWKDALFEAANLSGFHSTNFRTECDLIEEIIKAVLSKSNRKCTNMPSRFHFIPDENYSNIESLILKLNPRDVRIIGLWGMGGIGKTALAAAIFQKLSSQYDSNYFLENVTEESKRHGLNYIFNRLLSTLLREEDLGIATLKVMPYNVMRRLRCMKAFIVLDDLNTTELLENLVGVGRDWLGPGSTVIVTTRDKDVLTSGGVDDIYEVKEMSFQNSFRVFSLYAFNQTHPKQGYKELSKRVVVYAKGIPLALEVLGSFLHSKTVKEWDSALAKLKEIPNAKIQKVLRLSYDELDDKEKNIFLDIACFFKGSDRNGVTKLLNDCGFFADVGIRNLLDKALIRVDLENHIEMHDLIQEMGRKIVQEESPMNPGQRSRLWEPHEVCDVLRNNRGTEAIETIFFEATQIIPPIKISSKAFKKMSRLRLLAIRDLKGIKSACLPWGLDSLPMSLRCLRWDGYPLKSLPSPCPGMLVKLSLRHSNVEKLWSGSLDLPNLEKLDLSYSKRLIECPNLSGAPNLKSVALNYCVRGLPLIDASIFSLQKLKFLMVAGCVSLKSLSSNTCSPSLRELDVRGCANLQEFSIASLPSIASTNRLFLWLGGWGLNELPPSILHIGNVESLCFPISEAGNLKDLPENFVRTIMFHESSLWDCKRHRDKYDPLITLRKALHGPAFMSLRRLVFGFCSSLWELPDNICLLSSLECLILFHCGIKSLPPTIKCLPRLKYLLIDACRMLRLIPALPQSIQYLRVWECESLQTVLSSTTSEPSEKSKCGFLLLNCTELDRHSCDTMLEDAVVRIELGARLYSAAVSENEDASSDDDDDDHSVLSARLLQIRTISDGIWYFLPAMYDKVRDWFHYHSTQASLSVELPPNLLGFAYYMVVSPGLTARSGDFGCECWLETSSGDRIIIKSFVRGEFTAWFGYRYRPDHNFTMMSDHALLWYDARFCKQIMEAVEERKAINDASTSYNPKLTFRFFIENPCGEEVAIKECGLRWIYPSTAVEEGGRETHDLKAHVGSEFDEQEITVPPTKKLKQCVFGTDPSNPEASEAEELRCLLEKLCVSDLVETSCNNEGMEISTNRKRRRE